MINSCANHIDYGVVVVAVLVVTVRWCLCDDRGGHRCAALFPATGPH